MSELSRRITVELYAERLVKLEETMRLKFKLTMTKRKPSEADGKVKNHWKQYLAELYNDHIRLIALSWFSYYKFATARRAETKNKLGLGGKGSRGRGMCRGIPSPSNYGIWGASQAPSVGSGQSPGQNEFGAFL